MPRSKDNFFDEVQLVTLKVHKSRFLRGNSHSDNMGTRPWYSSKIRADRFCEHYLLW